MADYRRRAIIASEEGGGGTIAPDFSTATWAEIQAYINENGTAGFADQVGKTREITLSDSSTHTLCLVNAVGNMYELSDGSGYTGMIVDFVELFAKVAYSSSSTNAGAFADVDPLGKTTLPAIEATLPQELRDIIPSVKVLKANSGTDSTLVSSDMKLFTPTIKEVIGSYGDGTFTESNAFTQWKYMSDNPQYRNKKLNGTTATWWTRSPARNATSNACTVYNGGGSSTSTGYTNAVSPCFCLAPTSTPPAPTPTSFADDDWATIKYAVDNNLASAVYSVGDTKTIMLSDNTVHTIRIANMTGNLYEYTDNAGTYTGFIVEFADCVQTAQWSLTNYNTGGWADSNIRVNILPTILALLPNDLGSIIPTVKVVSARTDTGTNVLISSNDKLFLPAEKELLGSGATRSAPIEADALTLWKYYETHNTDADRIKKYNNTATAWWERSPRSKNPNSACNIMKAGIKDASGVESNYGVSPCFCI